MAVTYLQGHGYNRTLPMTTKNKTDSFNAERRIQVERFTSVTILFSMLLFVT